MNLKFMHTSWSLQYMPESVGDPDSWKVSSVVVIFKNTGEMPTAKNYRTVGLLSVVNKIFVKHVNNRIVDHLEKYGLFSNFQHIFSSSWSTTDALTVKAFNKSRATGVVALDISKKFQHIEEFGIFWKWIGLFLSKKHLLRFWGWISLPNWIGAHKFPLLLKMSPWRLQPWFLWMQPVIPIHPCSLWIFFLPRLLCISVNILYDHGWNIVVMSGLVLLSDTWNYWISYRNGYAGLLVLYLLSLLRFILEM